MSQCAFCKEMGHTLSKCDNERIPGLVAQLVNSANYSIVYQPEPLYLTRDLERLVVAERRMVSRKLGLGCGGNKSDIIRVLYDNKKGNVETARAALNLDTVVAGLTEMYTSHTMLFEPCCQFERDLREKVERDIAREREIDTCKFKIMCSLIDVNRAYRETCRLEGIIFESTGMYNAARDEGVKLRDEYELAHYNWRQAKNQADDTAKEVVSNRLNRPDITQLRKAHADSRLAETQAKTEHDIHYAAMLESDKRIMDRYDIMDDAIAAYHASYLVLQLAIVHHAEAQAELEAVQTRYIDPIKFNIATVVKLDHVFEDIDCPVCLETTVPLVVAGCKHTICHSCLPILLTRSQEDKQNKTKPCCPLCRQNITQLTFSDAAICLAISEQFCC